MNYLDGKRDWSLGYSGSGTGSGAGFQGETRIRPQIFTLWRLNPEPPPHTHTHTHTHGKVFSATRGYGPPASLGIASKNSPARISWISPCVWPLLLPPAAGGPSGPTNPTSPRLDLTGNRTAPSSSLPPYFPLGAGIVAPHKTN